MFLKFVGIIFLIGLSLADFDPPMKPRLYLTNEEGEDITAATDPFDGNDYRLPNTTKPISYQIWVSTEVHRNVSAFEGKVKITIEAVNNTNEIVIHYRQTTIVKIDLLNTLGVVIESEVDFTSKDDVEFLIIKPKTSLIQGRQYIVDISYIGVLREDRVGLYRTTYTDSNGIVVPLASTKFEPHNARHAFPCYDEPWIRATYDIEIRHGVNYTAISNMPEISKTIDPSDSEFVTTKFATLPSVQSYLVAFMISDMKYAFDNSTLTPQRIFLKPQSIDNNEAELALQVSGEILDGFAEYFGINYSLPKMDQVGFPDFVSGAMENWGMVTYREAYLSFDNKTSRAIDRENIMTIIAHEFTHQWTGNLVSPIWWTYLWLNEGFAAMYENYILEFVYKGERWAESFISDTVQPVMITDANPSIRPMNFYVESPERVSNLFDSIAYSKSASVLKTFQYAVGEEVWREGMKNYLTSRSFNFASPEHLHEGIQKAVNASTNGAPKVNIATAMESWESQSGFPFVTVSRNGNSLKITQKRFTYNNTSTYENLWWIPLSFVTSKSPVFTNTKAEIWMEGAREINIQNSDIATADWIIFNLQQSSYYRVNYDENLWQGIIKQLNNDPSKIHVLNRAQLVDDSFHLARAAYIDSAYNKVFWILNYLENEVDYNPWVAANRVHTSVNLWLPNSSEIYQKFQQMMKRLTEKFFNKFGVNSSTGDSRVDRYARNLAINLACLHQNENCLKQTNEKLKNVMLNGGEIEPDLVTVIHCNGMRIADQTFFQQMVQKMLASTSSSERQRISLGVDCVQNETLYYSFLQLGIQENSLTLNERNRIMATAPKNSRNHISVLMKFLADNYTEINSRGLLNNVIGTINNQITNKETYAEFSNFLSKLRDEQVISETLYNNWITTNPLLTTYSVWQDWNLKDVEKFFVELETVPTEPPTTPPPTSAPTTIQQVDTTTNNSVKLMSSIFLIVISSFLMM